LAYTSLVSATATAKATYEKGRDAYTRQVAVHEGRARLLGVGRLAIAVVALVLLGLIVWGRIGAAGWVLLVAALAVFTVLVFVHAGVESAKEQALAALRFHVRGLARLAHAWDALPRHANLVRTNASDHPFASDLDIFGHGSVMQLADTTETRLGEERLAALLSLEAPGPTAEWLARQEAVRELAGKVEFREALATAAGVLADDKPDPGPLLAWAEGKAGVSPGLAWLAWVLPALAAGALALRTIQGARAPWATWVPLAVLAVGIGVGAQLSPFLEAASARESAATRWRAMVAAVEAQSFEAPLLRALRERFVGTRRASDEMASLARIVGFVDARRNDVFRLFIGPLLMWDVHGAVALDRWRTRAGGHVRAWLEAIGEMEALAGLAAFAFEHPDFAWPEAAEEAVFQARGLGHPLVADEKRVGNDVHLPSAGTALVVTGSNMSGKSTLLRAIGVNAVLAYAGAPVCAQAIRLGPTRVATSMRIEDSLEQGVSHFYAELRRLKRVLDLAHSPGAPVLFLLDEILHGTNSRERVIGACAVVRELLARGAYGAVSTHDLGITALGAELGGRVQNVHFEEQVAEGTMTFDYVLRPGIVQSSNALRLMRAVGIDVHDDDRIDGLRPVEP
jgi:ABC-type multidrug transport system fused ATPase/permease subunit